MTTTKYRPKSAFAAVALLSVLLLPAAPALAAPTPKPSDAFWASATRGEFPDRVRLEWGTASDSVKSFSVIRCLEGATEYEVLADSLTEREYEDTTLVPNVRYSYQIWAIDVGGGVSKSDFMLGWAFPCPDNDDFENARTISAKSGSEAATNNCATFQADEPFPSGVGTEVWRATDTTNTVWWSYVAPLDGVVQFNTDGSRDLYFCWEDEEDEDPYDSIRTAMAVYTGDALGSLQEVCRAYGGRDHEQSVGWCTNAFETEAGTVYRIQAFSDMMDDGGTGKGKIRINWSYTHLRVSFDADGGTISTNSVMVPMGQKLGDALAAFPVPVKENYQFVDWKFENNASASASADAPITENHTFRAEWSWVPPNDNFEDALPLALPGLAGGYSKVPNTNATVQAGEPLLDVYPAATHTLWWEWTAPANGTAHLSTTNSTVSSGHEIDTVLGVYTGDALGSLTQVATGDDGVDESGFIDDVGTFWSFVDFEAVKGTTYYVCVGVNDKYNRGAVEGTIRLNWSLVTTEPISGGFVRLPPSATRLDILSALGEVTDPRLQRLFDENVDDYNDFAEWANGKGADAVRASSHAAPSYRLGTARLLLNEPEVAIKGVDVVPVQGNATAGESAKAVRPRALATPVTLTLTVTVRDGGEPVEVTAAKVAALVEATRDVCDWDSPEMKLDPHAEAVTSGSDTRVTIVATPGDGDVPQAFLRVAP